MSLSLEAAIRDIFGPDVRVSDRTMVSGGDINDSSLLVLSNGERVFLKENRGKSEDFFTAEAEGLKALGAAGVIDVAKALATGGGAGDAFLLLEYIEGGRPMPDFWYGFGRRLALLHKSDAASFIPGGRFGFTMDNYIGATPQSNKPCDTWVGFFREMRLEAQFRMAWHYFDEGDRKRIGALLDDLDRYLTEPKAPSLLHGDLWGGNFMVNKDGCPVLIDPAVYVGHAEADIAMTELFGGFRGDFYRGYHDELPEEPGYEDRRSLYNLYHLLNHLNLFGSGYLSGVLGTVRRYS